MRTLSTIIVTIAVTLVVGRKHDLCSVVGPKPAVSSEDQAR